MIQKKPIKVGLIGFGNIGKGVVEYFTDGRGKPFNVHLKRVAVRDVSKHREHTFAGLTDKVSDIINDREISIVVELVGGINPARKYILDSIKHGKSVVTANKAVMAKHTKELFDAARTENVDIAFEASVGGGIPIINTLNRYKGEKIEKVMGILNGTTNFVLTQMEDGQDFNTAIGIAQKRGFAEANHILDTGGFDSRDKLALLTSLIFNAQVAIDKIPLHGITDITPVDVDFAAKYGVPEGGAGYAIKLLAIAERENGSVTLRVNPVLISKNHPLASVRNEVNAVYIEGELAGPQTFIGKGAGTAPTTSAVISDILRVANNIQRGVIDDLLQLDSKIKYVSPHKSVQEGYIRVDLLDKPGSILAVAKIIAHHKLNIRDSIQRQQFAYTSGGKTYIPDIITIDATTENVIEKVLKELRLCNRVNGEPLFMSINKT